MSNIKNRHFTYELIPGIIKCKTQLTDRERMKEYENVGNCCTGRARAHFPPGRRRRGRYRGDRAERAA